MSTLSPNRRIVAIDKYDKGSNRTKTADHSKSQQIKLAKLEVRNAQKQCKDSKY